MTPSAFITNFIRTFESCRLTAYLPTPNDVWTIGYGHTLGVHPGMTWAQETADAAFASDIATFGYGVWSLVIAYPTNQNQFDAMTSLAFNIGMGNFKNSSVLTNHRAGHYQTAQWSFGLWNKQRGADGQLRVLPGLTQRRSEEASIYGKPVAS